MNSKALFSVFFLATSIACINQKANFEVTLNRWIGRPITEFMRANVEPTETKALEGGGREHIFDITQKRHLSAAPSTDFYSSTPTYQHQPLRETSRNTCRLILTTNQQGTILTTRYEGTGCW